MVEVLEIFTLSNKWMKKLLVLLVFSLLACGQSDPILNGRYVCCDSVVVLEKWPEITTLPAPQVLDIQCLGASSFNLIDSLLVVQKSAAPYYEIFDMSNKKSQGEFVHQGNGPGEFLCATRISSLYHKDGQCVAEIYDQEKNTIEVFNISQSIAQKKTVISPSPRKPQRALSSFFVNDSVECIFDLNQGYTQHLRLVKIADSPVNEIASAKRLNEASVSGGMEESYVLSATQVINKDQLLVAEAPLAHQQINIYSIVDESISLTICLGKELKPIEELQRVGRKNVVYYHGEMKAYDDFFAVLYAPEVRGEEPPLPMLHVFSWKGEFLARVQLTEPCHSFDIDLVNRKLIALDRGKERFLIYDVP